MNLIADILLAGGAFGVAIYCIVLSRRLTRFTDLERGVGGAVAVLSAQVDELTRALESARSTADRSGESLGALTERAEEVSRRLELHVASLHDLEPAAAPAAHDTAAREPATPEAAAHEAAAPMPSFRSAAPGRTAPDAAGFASPPRVEAAPGDAPAAPADRPAAGDGPMRFRATAARPAPSGPEPLSAPSRAPSYFSRRPAAVAK